MDNQKSYTKKDQVVEALRELIEQGLITRGERIYQHELAAQFAVSTTPVREALRELQAEGLLVGEPHRGVRVASVDLDEVRGIYVMRRLVEPYVAERAALRMSRQDINRGYHLNQEMRFAHQRRDHEAVREANHAFHFSIYNECGLPSLARRVSDLWAEFPWDILQVISTRVSESISEHDDLLRSVEATDLRGIHNAMNTHIKRSYVALVGHLRGSVDADPFELDID